MGRRKIEIAPLSDDRNRSVTFAKRKQGLMKKAYELGVLCNAEVAVVIFAQNGKPYEFSSIGNIDSTLLRYSNLSDGAIESKGPEDFGGVTPANGQGGSKTSHQGEEEDEMEPEDHMNGRAEDGSNYSGSETAAPTSKRRKISQPASGETPGHQSQSVEPSSQPAEGSSNVSPYDRGVPNHPPSMWPPQSGYTMPTSYAQLPPSFLSTQLAHMQRTYPFLPGLENLQALQMPNLFYGMPPNPGFNPGNPGQFYPPGKTARNGDPFDRLPNGTAPEPGQHPLEIPRGITDLGAAIPRPPRAASPIEEGHRAPPPSGTFEDYLSNLDGHAGPSFRWPGQEEPADATAAFREKRAAGELAVEGEAKSARTEE